MIRFRSHDMSSQTTCTFQSFKFFLFSASETGGREVLYARIHTYILWSASHAINIAWVYKQAIERHRASFIVIAFAIFYAGHGENNYAIVKSLLSPED